MHSFCTFQCLQAGASHSEIPVQVRKAGASADSEGTVPAETEVVHMDQNDSWFRDTGPAVGPPLDVLAPRNTLARQAGSFDRI